MNGNSWAAPKLAPHYRLAFRVYPVSSKQILCQVDTQCSNIHFRTLVSVSQRTKIRAGAVGRRTQGRKRPGGSKGRRAHY
jgi:hypothetical protein